MQSMWMINLGQPTQLTQAAHVNEVRQTDNAPVIQEHQVRSLPIPVEHQDLIIRHMDRLTKIIYARSKRDIGRYTNRETAIRQYAWMTIVVRRIERQHSRGEVKFEKDNDEDADEAESIVADLVDASFFVDEAARAASHAVIGSVSYDRNHDLNFGEEQECERLVQEILAESVDQVSELWDAQAAVLRGTALRECGGGDDIWKDVDFAYFYAANATVDEIRPTPVPLEKRLERLENRLDRLEKSLSVRYRCRKIRSNCLSLLRSRLSLRRSYQNLWSRVRSIWRRLPERMEKLPERPQRLPKYSKKLPKKLFPRRSKKKVDIRWPPKPQVEESPKEMDATESADFDDLRL